MVNTCAAVREHFVRTTALPVSCTTAGVLFCSHTEKNGKSFPVWKCLFPLHPSSWLCFSIIHHPALSDYHLLYRSLEAHLAAPCPIKHVAWCYCPHSVANYFIIQLCPPWWPQKEWGMIFSSSYWIFVNGILMCVWYSECINWWCFCKAVCASFMRVHSSSITEGGVGMPA